MFVDPGRPEGARRRRAYARNMVTDLVPASYDLLWTLTLLLALVIVPASLAVVGYGVVRFGVRHELAR